MLDECLKYSEQLVRARVKPKPFVDKVKEEIICQQMITTGTIYGIKQTIKKIKAWKTK